MSTRRESIEPEPSVESGREGPPIKLIALLVLIVALAIFFFQNSDDAPISFLWMDASWPVWAVIGVSFVFGVLIDRLVAWQWNRARRRG